MSRERAGRSDRDRIRRLVDEKAADEVAILCFDHGHLEIGADDRVGVDDIFEVVSNSIFTGTGEVGTKTGAVFAEFVATRANGLKVFAAGAGVERPERGFGENFFHRGDLGFLLTFAGADAAPGFGDGGGDVGVVQLGELADVESVHGVAFHASVFDGGEERFGERSATGESVECGVLLVRVEFVETREERFGGFGGFEAGEERDGASAKPIVIEERDEGVDGTGILGAAQDREGVFAGVVVNSISGSRSTSTSSATAAAAIASATNRISAAVCASDRISAFASSSAAITAL
jgi:hypothetical protein